MLKTAIRTLIEETAVLVALGLFVATVAVWAQILADRMP